MHLAFLEPSASGHGPVLLRGCVDAALAAGHQVTLIGPPDAVVDGAGHVPSVLDGSRWGPTRHRILEEARRRATDIGADGLACLTYDYFRDAAGRPASPLVPTAYVVHSVHQLEPAPDRPPSVPTVIGAARRRAARARLRRYGSAPDGHLLAHLADGTDRLRRLTGDDRPGSAPWPVAPEQRLPALREGSAVPPTLVLPGEARPEKGVAAFVEAALRLPPVRVLVNGRIAPACTADVDRLRTHTVVDAETGWPTPNDYWRRLRQGTIAVLPYTARYDAGRVSAALLDAVAVGLPLVIVPRLRPHVPTGFEGVVVAASDDVGDLADAITEAIDRTQELTALAAATGPAAIRDGHTYEIHVAALIAALTR